MALVTLGGVVASLIFLDTTSTTGLGLSSDVLALMGLALLAVPAWLTLRARDPRRFVLGVLAAALLWLLLWYPNIAGLPLPSDFASIYQGLLPTWNHAFQFAVNADVASDNGMVGSSTFVVAGVTLIFVSAVAAAAWRWGRPAGRPQGPPPR